MKSFKLIMVAYLALMVLVAISACGGSGRSDGAAGIGKTSGSLTGSGK